jgi:hypothetical protein
VLIVMENTEYVDVVDAQSAPYINDTLIPEGTLFANYHAVSHPSLPNYLAMTSGSTQSKQGTDSILPGEIQGENLFQQLSAAGISWAAYEEGLPSQCDRSVTAGTAPSSYVLKHDPAMAYAGIANTSLCRNVRPMSALDVAHLPRFSFLTPDECHDMHSCGVGVGDAWLHEMVPSLSQAGAIVIVTFDEGSTDTGGGGHVLTLEIGSGVPHARNAAPFDHYSLLAGLELRFHLGRLGDAGSAAVLPIGGS